MSTPEPPAGPPADQPPTPPPADGGGAPPPPPPPSGYGAPPTPAPVPGVPRPAELLDRFLARLIDGVILGVVYGVLFAILGAALIRDAKVNSDFTVDEGSSVLFYIVFSIVVTALQLGYFAYLESSRGQTLGKQIMKLQVYGPDGTSNPTMEQALRRNIWLAAGFIGVIPVLGGALGGLAELAAVILIAIGINSDTVKRQHWFDHFATGTQVVKIG